MTVFEGDGTIEKTKRFVFKDGSEWVVRFVDKDGKMFPELKRMIQQDSTVSILRGDKSLAEKAIQMTEKENVPFDRALARLINAGSFNKIYESGGEVKNFHDSPESIERAAKIMADNLNYTNEFLVESYNRYTSDLEGFLNHEIPPRKIIGTGHKPQYARKLSQAWLEDRIAEYKKALKMRGVNINTDSKMENGGEVTKNPEIAKTILLQLGGAGRLRAMTGAYDIYDIGNGLSFKVKSRFANYVKITLNSMDTYDMEIGLIRAGKYKVIEDLKGLHFDQLKPIIEKTTGMYLSLFKRGGSVARKRFINEVKQMREHAKSIMENGGNVGNFDFNNYYAAFRAGNGEAFVTRFVDIDGNQFEPDVNEPDSSYAKYFYEADGIAKSYEHGSEVYGKVVYLNGKNVYSGLNDSMPIDVYEAVSAFDKLVTERKEVRDYKGEMMSEVKSLIDSFSKNNLAVAYAKYSSDNINSVKSDMDFSGEDKYREKLYKLIYAHNNAEDFLSKYKHKGESEKEGSKSGNSFENKDYEKALKAFDIDDLDEFESMEYAGLVNVFKDKAEALRVLINNVEGDYSQLSPDLADIAYKYSDAEYDAASKRAAEAEMEKESTGSGDDDSSESEHTYKIGEGWRSDFDYYGMLEMAMEANVSWGEKKLNKLLDSFTDVNYHTLGKMLTTEINLIKEKKIKEAEVAMETFHAAVKEEIDEMDGGEEFSAEEWENAVYSLVAERTGVSIEEAEVIAKQRSMKDLESYRVSGFSPEELVDTFLLGSIKKEVAEELPEVIAGDMTEVRERIEELKILAMAGDQEAIDIIEELKILLGEG